MIALRHNFDQSKCQCRTVNPHRILLRIWPMSDCYNTLCYHTKGIFGSSNGTLQVHGLSFASKTGPLPSIIGKTEVLHLLRPTRASQFARLLPRNFLTLSDFTSVSSASASTTALLLAKWLPQAFPVWSTPGTSDIYSLHSNVANVLFWGADQPVFLG